MEDEKLIECVSVFQELYDTSHRKYMDHAWKVQIWTEIGEKLSQDPVKCKTRWESLRAQFRKYTRNMRIATEQSAIFNVKFKYVNQLEFLKPHLKGRKRSASALISDEETSDQDEDDDETDPERSDIKLKHEDSNAGDSEVVKTIPELDEIDHFFAAMKGSFRKFAPVDQLHAKQEIFRIIMDIEIGQFTGRSSVTSQMHLPNHQAYQSPYSSYANQRPSPLFISNSQQPMIIASQSEHASTVQLVGGSSSGFSTKSSGENIKSQSSLKRKRK